eukprot:352872-Chlamydomonas_euryale.AAC.4
MVRAAEIAGASVAQSPPLRRDAASCGKSRIAVATDVSRARHSGARRGRGRTRKRNQQLRELRRRSGALLLLASSAGMPSRRPTNAARAAVSVLAARRRRLYEVRDTQAVRIAARARARTWRATHCSQRRTLTL